MKLHALLLLVPVLTAASPLAAPEALPEPGALVKPIAEPTADLLAERETLEARAARKCALTGSNVKYRRCPSQSCDAVGEYGAKGTKVPFQCFTTGQSINGDTYWDKTSTGYYVSETLVDTNCAYDLPHC